MACMDIATVTKAGGFLPRVNCHFIENVCVKILQNVFSCVPLKKKTAFSEW